jgi:hypothetical protein
MTTHTSPHSLRPHRRLRRRLGWIPLGAALALSASCAAAVGDAAPSNDGPRPCAIGTYDVTTIEAHSLFGLERGSTIRGSGGSMRLTIDADGSWRLFDDGSEEMRLAGGPLTARFTARGIVEGRYEPDGDGWAFTHTRATGAASLRLPFVGTTRIPLADVGSSMVPDGRASISCDGDTVTMTSTERPAITLTLGDE